MITGSSAARFAACPLAVFLLLLTGCGGGSPRSTLPGSPSSPTNPSSPSSSTAAFTVTTISPAAGAVNVPLNSTIEVVFSSAANAATVNSTDIQVTNPKPVAGAIAYDATSDEAVFTPSAPLAANSQYTVTVSGVTSSTGTAMANPFKWSFATVTSSSSPAPTPAPAATMQYQAPLIPSGPGSLNGQISIDTAGNMTVQLTGATASTTYSVQFCPAAIANADGNQPGPCFSVGNISTNASGNGTLTEVFPKSGSWAGDFSLDLGTTAKYSTYLVPGLTGETYMSTLQPDSTVNGVGLGSSGAAGASTSQAPLTSGTVTYAKGAVTYTVTGTFANTGFSCSESETTYLDGSGTYQTDTFTTDASGDATSSSTSFGPGGDLFQVDPPYQKGMGFVGGFSVPK